MLRFVNFFKKSIIMYEIIWLLRKKREIIMKLNLRLFKVR